MDTKINKLRKKLKMKLEREHIKESRKLHKKELKEA